MLRRTMPYRPWALAALLLLFSGCGQSGPLYIPGDPSRMSVPPENPENAQQTDDEDENNGESN